MNRILPVLPLVALAVVLMPPAHADIYKCTDEDGNVAYLQLPCPVKRVEPEGKDDVAKKEQPEDVAETLPEPQAAPQPPPSSREPGEPLAACRKRFRDQIDEIDAEMRIAYSTENSESYKARLLALTQQLRECG